MEKYVYDFSVKDNESFMVDDGILVHNTIDSFHSASIGVLSNTTGSVPRIKELTEGSKNPKN